MKARDVIVDALERCNKLSPGETPDSDLLAFCMRRLNGLVDELSAQQPFLYQDILTSAPVTGSITLGAGAWAAIEPGSIIVSATADNFTMRPITMAQFNELFLPDAIGFPSVYAQDGMATVHLWPVPAGQTIKLQTRKGVQAFADYGTDYAAPAGYPSALGAALAVRIAPVLIGGVTPDLLRAEERALSAIDNYKPAILDVYSYTGFYPVLPSRLLN